MSRTLSGRILPTLLAVSVGSSTAAQVPAPWTSVGSAGTVDEADLLVVQLGTPVPGAVSMRPVFRGVARIRYNVVAVGGVLEGPVILRARFLDRSDLQRVFLELKEYNLVTGLTTTLLTLDSDSYAAAPAFQVQSVGGCPPFARLNFAENAYFVDALLSRFPPRPGVVPPPSTAALVEPAGTGPALAQVKIEKGECNE
jgi:hypothetical protein